MVGDTQMRRTRLIKVRPKYRDEIKEKLRKFKRQAKLLPLVEKYSKCIRKILTPLAKSFFATGVGVEYLVSNILDLAIDLAVCIFENFLKKFANDVRAKMVDVIDGGAIDTMGSLIVIAMGLLIGSAGGPVAGLLGTFVAGALKEPATKAFGEALKELMDNEDARPVATFVETCVRLVGESKKTLSETESAVRIRKLILQSIDEIKVKITDGQVAVEAILPEEELSDLCDTLRKCRKDSRELVLTDLSSARNYTGECLREGKSRWDTLSNNLMSMAARTRFSRKYRILPFS